MKRMLVSLTVVISMLFASCGSAPVCNANTQPTPASYEASFVESSGTGEMMIKATGLGCTMEEATNEAKKTAIWFVLEGGDKPILKSPAEKTKAVGLAQQMYANNAKYIRYQSEIKGKTKQGDKTKLTYLFKVDVAMITEELVASEIISSSEDIGEKIGMPTISVFADKGGDYAKTAVVVIQEYFTDNSFEVYKADQGDKVNNLVSKISTLEGADTDPMHDMALSLGSDIYAKINYSGGAGSMGTAKASVVVEVYETASGKMLGSTTGYSAERRVTDPNALVQEATNDASSKILSQIKKEWMEMVKKGKPFKVTVLSNSNDGPAVDEAIYGALKNMSPRPIKRQGGGKSTFSYIAYIKDVPNAYELFMNIKNNYSGPGKLEKVSDTGSFLVFKATSTGNIELTIE
ncbi:MAG TPA: DUF6175 family protein [bacterium]|nr:hypothetical protein [bacterium]HNW15271.1 DUF6175 family protein [bacterium]HNZ53026.1 DUF6175 family protein [bacterium]HOB71482.1 DUF6175 family protein [bacterium]HOG43296.1 DUF6175 family protein [bacterium]